MVERQGRFDVVARDGSAVRRGRPGTKQKGEVRGTDRPVAVKIGPLVGGAPCREQLGEVLRADHGIAVDVPGA
jgi:hypothetical protein